MRAGSTHTAETKAKMSASRRGKPASEQTKKRLAEANKGNTYCLGKKHSPETRAKMSAAHKGKVKTHEHLANISKAKKGVPQKAPQSPEQREKNRQAQLGNQRALGAKHTQEMRNRRAELSRQMWLDGVFDAGHKTWGEPGYHNGVWMRCLNSEGVFAWLLDKAEIKWLYEPQRFKLSWCSYTPDFYLPELDVWVEVKGWLKPKQARKIETFRQETGKTLSVIFQKELPHLFYSKLLSSSEQEVYQN